MKKWLARIGFTVLGLVLVVFVGLAVWEPLLAEEGTAPPPETYTAEIVRDEFGVPHIYGKRDVDVAYGIAQAHSEDDFSTLQDVAAMTRGRYAAIAGQDGATFDFAFHALDVEGTVERHYDELAPDVRAILDAYATGLNDYAADHPGEVKLDNLFPVDGRDIAAGFALRQPFFFGLAGKLGALVEGKDYLPDPGRPIDPSPLPVPGSEEERNMGSNAFAIAPEKSGGETLLVSNSHQPWRGGVAWYELVVESGEGWHFAGATFPGSPYPFLGHNENLGWTNTVNQPDMYDVYELTVSKEVVGNDHKLVYELDGEWRELESKDVTLPVRVGPIVLPIQRTVYRSVHGPVIKNDKGYFAIRYGGIDSISQLDAYYRLNKAKTLAEWKGILSKLQIPSTNFIYADDQGNIAYYYNAAIPDRQVGPDWRGILPGNDSALIWTDYVGFEELPQYENPSSGWLFNANNNPFSAAGSADDLKAEDFPAELGIETKSTNRARRAARLMSEANLIDRANLERIKYDTGWEREGYVAAALDGIAALDLQEGRYRDAQALLADWDLNSDGVGRADALALLIMRQYMGKDYNLEPLPDPREELVKAADFLVENYGRIDPPMSEVLRLRQGPGPYAVDLPLDGGSDTLRASTLWDVDDDGRLSVKHGDSFVMFTVWKGDEPVMSESIQPFGAATTRPDDPNFTSQAPLFVRHELKPVFFWRPDVMENAVGRKTVTSKR
ncbi:acylase [Pseudoblastomonas halimionae]|uniref:Acylase n=1 Tax=Alteriqipengyuania halimionae TaxID=1926630 RepID=A0A6I4U737_9SPHN|nr:acylase [Alteriqipengyuania halimionae]MXP10201.1 acylase [Alteriqipengyuania halimionae]